MAAGDSKAGERTLEYTPAWALATVSAAFILISFAVERSLHVLGHYLHENKRKSLGLALQKLKDELMLMGFISLTITIVTDPISKICVKSDIYDKWTPCDIKLRPNATSTDSAYAPGEGRRRLLAAAVGTSSCGEGKEPLMSAATLHQLHIFIFVLACIHVAYSCLTMVLSLTKVYTWRKWEREVHEAVAQQNATEFTSSVRYSRQSTFVRYHSSKPLGVKFLVWVVCFFKQFYVRRADYLTLRLSFVTTHNLRDNYNFHAYMIRCMEEEFETIVGISVWLWGFVIAYLLFSVSEPKAHYWVALVPLVVVLIIGMKLQHVIATLALEHSGVNGPFVGVLLKPRDQLFWFNKPKFVLHIIHFILFESAFELASFIWHVWQFNYKTCLLDDNKAHLYFSLCIGVATQLVCCFITLPLYALVSQMSTMPKSAFLPKRVTRGLKKWHEGAKNNLKRQVMETYQNHRLARMAITPLDEQYILRPENCSDSAARELQDVPRLSNRPMSSPMNVVMEEGILMRASGATNQGAKDAEARYGQPQSYSKPMLRVSPRFRNDGAHAHEEQQHIHSHLHQTNHASEERRASNGKRELSNHGRLPQAKQQKTASPKGAMNLNIPPFQRLQEVLTFNPLRRSFTTK